jgi:hypothetical protein
VSNGGLRAAGKLAVHHEGHEVHEGESRRQRRFRRRAVSARWIHGNEKTRYGVAPHFVRNRAGTAWLLEMRDFPRLDLEPWSILHFTNKFDEEGTTDQDRNEEGNKGPPLGSKVL